MSTTNRMKTIVTTLPSGAKKHKPKLPKEPSEEKITEELPVTQQDGGKSEEEFTQQTKEQNKW